jgi:hypothetical protein
MPCTGNIGGYLLGTMAILLAAAAFAFGLGVGWLLWA